MAINAQRILAWRLDDIDCTDLYQTVERAVLDDDGNPVLEEVDDGEGGTVKIPKKIKAIQSRSQWVISRSRKVVGVRSFAEEAGQTSSAFDLATGPETAFRYASTGKTFVCTRDHLGKPDTITGEAVQDQTWLYLSKWEDVDDDAFE